MKIGFDAKRALNNSTGLGNYSRHLINGLLKFFPENEYTLFSPSVSEFYTESIEGHYRIFLPQKTVYKTFGSWWRSYGISHDIAQERLHIYHGLSNEIPMGIDRARTRTVVTIHDLLFLEYPEQYRFIDRTIYEAKTKYAVKHADKVIAVSEQTKLSLIKHFQLKPEKVEVIYPIVELQHTGSESMSKAKYILNVGSLVARKNQHRLIEAYAMMEKNIAEELWIVGNGPMKKELEQVVKQLKLAGRVKIITGIDNHQLAALYKSATAFVYPSLMEGFGMPVAEALLSGIPVVASAGGAIEEAAGAGSVFFDPCSIQDIAKQLSSVIDNQTLRQQMIASGLAHAQKMNSKNLSEQMMAVYRSLV